MDEEVRGRSEDGGPHGREVEGVGGVGGQAGIDVHEQFEHGRAQFHEGRRRGVLSGDREGVLIEEAPRIAVWNVQSPAIQEEMRGFFARAVWAPAQPPSVLLQGLF